MRILFALFFSIRLSAALAMSKDIYSLRQLHYEAAAKKDSSKRLLSDMEIKDVKSNPLLKCYKGMVILIKAHYYYDAYMKLAYFYKGKDKLQNQYFLPQKI